MHVSLKTSSGALFAIDWAAWQPAESAVLTFIEEDDRILLIHKKRGLGAGLYSAPGGRIDPGESPEQAAIRETVEEIRVTPSGLKKAGILDFAFTDGYFLRCHVFKTACYAGIPAETDEAVPVWFGKRELPYGGMWSDDRIWIPLMLSGRYFTARFIFEGELMLWHLLQVDEA